MVRNGAAAEITTCCREWNSYIWHPPTPEGSKVGSHPTGLLALIEARKNLTQNTSLDSQMAIPGSSNHDRLHENQIHLASWNPYQNPLLPH